MSLSRFVLLFFLFPIIISITFSGNHRTLQSFGVRVERGQPVYPLPDNVAFGLFNLEDPLLDVAYYADGKVQVFQNLGNGLLSEQPVYERRVGGAVMQMRWQMREMFYPCPSDLILTYADGREETLTYEWMVQRQKSFAALPQLNAAFPPIDFREVWRSETQTQPTRFMSIGDIDNDGRLEMVYAFYRFSNDTVRYVVYECVGNDSFVVDWDTLLIRAFGPYTISDVDNDGHKEIVLTYHPGGGTWSSRVAVLECLGQRNYRFYETNITFDRPPFKIIQGDVDHDGRKELVLHTSTSQPPPGQDATLIHVAEFYFRYPTYMSFSTQVAMYGGYTFNFAVGQIDGEGRDEIIPSGGSFGVNEPVPIEYLWHDGTTWRGRRIHTGLRSGTTAPMFVNLDADTTLELFIGAVGPIGHGSCYALDYVSDTTWRVLWADSSLRNSPLSVNAGVLAGQFVVAGANTWTRAPADTEYTDLNVYRPSGTKLGIWRRDSASVQNFHILDIDNDGIANLVAPLLSIRIGDHLGVYEYSGTLNVGGLVETPAFELSSNHPNPFNPSTLFSMRIPATSHVRVTVYDILGKEVSSIFSGEAATGMYTLRWHGTNHHGLPAGSGVYFVRMVAVAQNAAIYTQTRKMVLVR